MPNNPIQWTPECNAQKKLEEMALNNQIKPETNAAFLKKMPEFAPFSVAVIGKNLRKIKSDFSISGGQSTSIVGIPEIDGAGPSGLNSSMQSEKKMKLEMISFDNPPFLLRSYKDPTNRLDKIIVAVSMFAGAENIKVDVNDCGSSAEITYDWPKVLYDIPLLFVDDKGKELENKLHPKVLGLDEDLETKRASMFDSPKATMTIVFPFQVQTDSSKWSVRAVRSQGSCVLVLEFCGIEKAYTKSSKIVDLTDKKQRK